MEEIDIKNLDKEKFKIQVLSAPEGLKVIIAGSIEINNAEDLIVNYFEYLHNAILARRLQKIELDITKLLFINSTGISALVKWFSLLPQLPPEQFYKIEIIYNVNVIWQKNSLYVLKKIAENNLHLVEIKL